MCPPGEKYSPYYPLQQLPPLPLLTAMEAEFLAFVAALPDDEIVRPVDPPRGHGRPGNALGVTWEIACTLGASVAMGDSPEDERLVAHRWEWLASDPEWLRLFRTDMTHKLAGCLETALPEEKYTPLCAEVLEAIPNALLLDGGSLSRLKARARLHRSSGRDGCAAKYAQYALIDPPAPTLIRCRPTPPRHAAACAFHFRPPLPQRPELRALHACVGPRLRAQCHRLPTDGAGRGRHRLRTGAAAGRGARHCPVGGWPRRGRDSVLRGGRGDACGRAGRAAAQGGAARVASDGLSGLRLGLGLGRWHAGVARP